MALMSTSSSPPRFLCPMGPVSLKPASGILVRDVMTLMHQASIRLCRVLRSILIPSYSENDVLTELNCTHSCPFGSGYKC